MGRSFNCFLSSDADEYFERNIEVDEALFERGGDRAIDSLIEWLLPFADEVNGILEVGCAGGHRLAKLSRDLGASGVGIDPSARAIEYGENKFPWLTLEQAVGDAVPFHQKFDLVHLGFFLYLVERSSYLRCVSEADRLVRPGGFLSILDFNVPRPYANSYSHNSNLLCYKMNNANSFIATGEYTLVNQITYDLSGDDYKFTKHIDNRVSIMLLLKESINVRA